MSDHELDGIGIMDRALMVVVVIVGLCVFLTVLWVFGLFHYGAKQDFEPAITAKIEREVAEKRALPPAEIAYWKRHERNSRLCRGQQWISQCCDNSLDSGSLTCLTTEK